MTAQPADIFISHASEDKEEIARPLAEALRQRGLIVWYDDYVLRLGDSLREVIDRGLSSSRFGVVILSTAFFSKEWPQRELNGLLARETTHGTKVLLPVWHRLTAEEVARFSPLLADKLAVSTAGGLEVVVQQILAAIEPGRQIPKPERATLPRREPSLSVGGQKTSPATPKRALEEPQEQSLDRNRDAPDPARWSEIAPYAALSLGSFLGSLALISLRFWKGDSLASLGLTGNFFYLILLSLGLTVAGFLFGALRSIERYSGHAFGVILVLVPVVGFTLVVLGGFHPPPLPSNFLLTVYVHGVSGPRALVLKNQGFVLLDLGAERRKEPIQDKGQALFPEIPANFRGQLVNVLLDAEGYEIADKGNKRRLDGECLYLPVRKKPGRLIGRVQNEAGDPVAGARITVVGIPAITSPSGHFDLTIPADLLKDELPLQAVANGYAPWHGSVVPGSDDITVILTHRF